MPSWHYFFPHFACFVQRICIYVIRWQVQHYWSNRSFNVRLREGLDLKCITLARILIENLWGHTYNKYWIMTPRHAIYHLVLGYHSKVTRQEYSLPQWLFSPQIHFDSVNIATEQLSKQHGNNADDVSYLPYLSGERVKLPPFIWAQLEDTSWCNYYQCSQTLHITLD